MTTINWDPSTRTLRQFAAAGCIFIAGLATIGLVRGGGLAAAVLPVTLAVGLGVSGWIRPAVLRLPYVLLTLAVSPIGTVASHVILLALFFGVITPLGLMARILRPDPLGACWDRRVQTYWQIRARPRDPSSYLRQA